MRSWHRIGYHWAPSLQDTHKDDLSGTSSPGFGNDPLPDRVVRQLRLLLGEGGRA
jgi:hypothetical protein